MLYFSPWVMRPSLYCCSNSLASSRVRSTIFHFELRHHHVVLAERDAGLERVIEAERHDAVAEDDRLLLPAMAVDGVDHRRDFALGHELVDRVERNLRIHRQHVAEDDAAGRGLKPFLERLALIVHAVPAVLDLGVQAERLLVQGVLDLGHAGVVAAHGVDQFRVLLELRFGVQRELPLARLALAHQREIIEAEHDVLRRHDDRLAVRRVQDVVGRHHQHARFQLRFQRQRNVHGHLVAVEVGVESGAD